MTAMIIGFCGYNDTTERVRVEAQIAIRRLAAGHENKYRCDDLPSCSRQDSPPLLGVHPVIEALAVALPEIDVLRLSS